MFNIKYADDRKISRAVKIWLFTGLFMILMQVVIGGVTRLTGSGLSITKWEIVTGSIPPLNQPEWQQAFELYQQTPQYQKINQGMSLDEFKFIFFWEYFHRLWARLMFFVFVIPFVWFLFRGLLSRRLMFRLIGVVLLAGLEGFFGWIMVYSGLIKRPWVNAYNLTLHLVTALVIFSYLLWTIFIAIQPQPAAGQVPALRSWRRYVWIVVGVAFLQLALGAMMSGTKAGLVYPTWPSMNGSYLPGLLLDTDNWRAAHFIDYDTHPFMPTLIQFLHRNIAYLLTILIVYFVWQLRKLPLSRALRQGNTTLVLLLGLQILLGILTLLNCVSKIPVVLGVFHQLGAVLLLSALLFVTYQFHNWETLPTHRPTKKSL
ncbi:MAG: COX15/CtaA family protein [Saprospiraceae bacterium]